MRTALLSLVPLMLWSVVAQGGECTISTARYKLADAGWWLTFKPVPKIAASNQTAAFIIELPTSGVTLEGRVFRANGYGEPLWAVEGPCRLDSAERCGFVEGDPSGIYGNYGGKVGWLDDARGAAAPDEIILPGLAVSLWYSTYRAVEFPDATTVGDVFVLEGCS